MVTADENPDYDTTPGRDTTDHIFVLSVNEAKRYFDSDSARQCRASAYCYAQGAEKGDGGACWWWLRTPGINFYSDAVVTARGAVYSAGFCNDNPAPAVRPAMWIDLGGT